MNRYRPLQHEFAHPRGWRTVLAALVVVLAVVFGFVHQSVAQRTVRESDFKATLLFNFSQFTQWPDTTLSSPDAPFVIGILGADPFGKFLDDLVRNEHTQGRSIVVRRFHNAEDAAVAQILFIGGDEAKHMSMVMATLGNRPVLTVCDAPKNGEGTQGCIIALTKKQNAVRIRINIDRARKAGLTISSKLLHFAEIAKSD